MVSLAGVMAGAGAADWLGRSGEPALPLVDAEWAAVAERGGVPQEERAPLGLAAEVTTMPRDGREGEEGGRSEGENPNEKRKRERGRRGGVFVWSFGWETGFVCACGLSFNGCTCARDD